MQHCSVKSKRIKERQLEYLEITCHSDAIPRAIDFYKKKSFHRNLRHQRVINFAEYFTFSKYAIQPLN